MPAEDGLVGAINGFRSTAGRLPVEPDVVLGTLADALAVVASNEGDLMKIRAQTRDFLLADAVSVRALIMKGKTLRDVWRRMTKNSYPRSILLRKGAENVGTGIVMGGSLITPLGC